MDYATKEIIANQSHKEKLYSEVEQKLKAWRHARPLPTYMITGYVEGDEESNRELFYDAFTSEFDDVFDNAFKSIFENKLNEEKYNEIYWKEHKALYREMNEKYGVDGTEVHWELDRDFNLAYRPQVWALLVVKNNLLKSDEMKLSLKEQLQQANYNKVNLHDFIKKKLWNIFLKDFIADEIFLDGEGEFSTALDSCIAEFIKQEIATTPITCFDHISMYESIKDEIDAIQTLSDKILQGNFLAYSMQIEAKLARWVEENGIEIDKLREVELEKVENYLSGFDGLFKELITLWLGVYGLDDEYSEFNNKFGELYSKLETKYKIDVTKKAVELRKALINNWVKLEAVTHSLNKDVPEQAQNLAKVES